MDLPKTTILPTDDPALADRMFKHLVNEEPLVLIVVLGAGPDAATFVQRADRLAGGQGEPRRVVWARKPSDIGATVATFKGLSVGVTADRGFSVAQHSAEVRDVVVAAEPVPDLARVLQLWANAEKDDGPSGAAT